MIAFRNALWQILPAPDLEETVVDTVMRGGNTDTNAAICGAFLGAAYGRDAIPDPPIDQLLAELPPIGRTGAYRPSTSGVRLAGGCAGIGGIIDFSSAAPPGQNP